jgi:DNA polymerase III alpha subunit
MMTVATAKDTYSLHAFANCFAEYGPAFEEGKLVIVEGQVMRRPDDDVQLAINSVRPLESSLTELIKGVTFLIESNGKSSEFIRLLRQELEQQMGQTIVRLGILVDSDQYVLAELASSLEWSLNKEQFSKISQHPSVKDILFDVPQPVAPPPAWGR